MYICVCKAVTESQIWEAIRSGASTRKEITDCLNVGTVCGKCNREVRDLLRLVQSKSGGNPKVWAGGAAAYGGRASGRTEVCF